MFLQCPMVQKLTENVSLTTVELLCSGTESTGGVCRGDAMYPGDNVSRMQVRLVAETIPT